VSPAECRGTLHPQYRHICGFGQCTVDIPGPALSGMLKPVGNSAASSNLPEQAWRLLTDGASKPSGEPPGSPSKVTWRACCERRPPSVILELDGADLRQQPFETRKATLASVLRRSRDGIQLVEHIEAEHGGTVFDHACRLGFEGIVSKRRDAPYRSGRSGTWLKVKNREHPAMSRDWEDRFS